MNGRFVTRKYNDRAALNVGRPSEIVVASNSFVMVGLEWLWQHVIGELRNDTGGLTDHLGKGRLIVGDSGKPVEPTDERLSGDLTDWAELDAGYPAIARSDAGVTLTFRAAFTEDKGNFNWRERGVTSVQGVLIDRSVQDQGRKAPGTIWTLEAILELTLGA